MNLRIGSGIDFHQLVEGRDLWIGGILIPHHKGALGHSDADVLLHAICDALLGEKHPNPHTGRISLNTITLQIAK